jgi:hypothetical protein
MASSLAGLALSKQKAWNHLLGKYVYTRWAGTGPYALRICWLVEIEYVGYVSAFFTIIFLDHFFRALCTFHTFEYVCPERGAAGT